VVNISPSYNIFLVLVGTNLHKKILCKNRWERAKRIFWLRKHMDTLLRQWIYVSDDRSVGVVTHYELDSMQIKYWWGRDFLHLFNRPWGPPRLLSSGCQVSFHRVKRPGCGLNHLPPLSPNVKERAELYHYSQSGLSPFPLTCLMKLLIHMCSYNFLY
jgi:hypothetical protein